MKSACLFPCFSYASIRIWILFSYISSVASSFILMRSLKYHYEQNVNAAVKSFHVHAKRYLYFSFVSNLYLSMKIFLNYIFIMQKFCIIYQLRGTIHFEKILILQVYQLGQTIYFLGELIFFLAFIRSHSPLYTKE